MAKLSLMKADCLERTNNMLDVDLHINLMNAISDGRKKKDVCPRFFSKILHIHRILISYYIRSTLY